MDELIPRDSEHVELENRMKTPEDDAFATDPNLNGDVRLAQGGEEEREQWSSKFDFMLSIIGYCVGIGNVWRFPYLCFQNGGATFLIPYFLMLAFCGIPMMMSEFSLGQYLSLAPPTLFATICRMGRGIGFAMMLISYLVSIYYNVIICWSIIYLVSSFTSEVPWKNCDPEWASDKCSTVDERRTFNDLKGNCTNGTRWINSTYQVNCSTDASKLVASSLEYYNNHVLGKTDSIDEIGDFRWKICLALFFAWTCVFLCLFKGVKTSGKVVWVTATMPYIVLFILFIRGVTLEGAGIGIEFYLKPEWDKLWDAKVWVAAASQIFYSLGVGWGTVLVYGSYNKFNNNCVFDAILVSCINCGTSFFAGFVVFSVLGFISHQLNEDISNVATSGPGLAFNVYPEAISRLPISPLWAVLFFLMLFTLGLDSQFGTLECIITGITDEYSNKFSKHKTALIAFTCYSLFILGLPLCTGGGVYILNLMDYRCGGIAMIFVAFIEAIVVAWGYGADRLAGNVETMIGKRPPRYFVICWKFISPGLLFIILLSQIIQWERVTLDGYVYPEWTEGLGGLLAASSFLVLSGFAIYEIYHAQGSTLREKICNTWKPDNDRISAIEEQQAKEMKTIHA
ncbi:sodium- and chloride-dependent GABA transporter 1-like isoform X2 [Dendronephthya gigantea]|nr:sodium- and chloride-dependent GABA transporter 1-like isoform X2 [Dendronephthya gigantea]XP_028399936.1 sodium- and chloride-dependent GABA transporter 1-like isoform X2 [Dendronephthya gigantea]XP_028399937.1 sodium- and chloride-dependent GABA transporter 1-like isoform X2 [Dendronephthya gigantea]